MVKGMLVDSSEVLEAAGEILSTPDVSKAYKDGKLDLDQINRITATVSPRERLLILLKSTLFLDDNTHESDLIHQSMGYGLMIGMTLGFIMKGADRHRDFIRNYNMAAFENIYIAKRKYLDTYISQGIIRSAKFGVQVSLLGGACCGALVVPMVIRDDEYRVSDSTLSMGAVCGLARLNMGMKAITMGSLVGMGLGAFAGVCIKSFFSFTGKTPQEIRFWNHSNYIENKMRKYKKMEEDKDKGKELVTPD